jgi:hypothetical protein
LQAAILFLRGGIRPDGSRDVEGWDEWDVAGSEWRLLEDWAARHQLALPAEFTPERPGGREHDVRFDPETNLWYKFTKPCCAGYTVHVEESGVSMLPATPLEYLERWNTNNRLFGELVELVGVQRTPEGPRLVISQPHVPGEISTWEEIEETFVVKSRMRRLRITQPLGGYDAHAYFKGRVGVFDVRPLNCFHHAETNELAAIDVIPRTFSRAEADILERIMNP